MQRRVVVTGMGMVTPVGRDLESTWSSLQEGRSGVGPITLFDASSFPTRIAAEVKGFDLADYIDDADRWDEHCRNTKFAIAAARMAIDHSGLESTTRPRPLPVRRLPRLGRGAAGLPPVRPAASTASSRDGQGRHRRASPARGSRSCTRSTRPSRSRARPPATSPASSAPGPERQLPDRLRRQLPGDRRGGRDHPPRRRRRDALGRHAQHDPPVRRDRLQPPDRALDPQRRARPAPAGRSTATATASSSAKGPGMVVLEELEHAKARGATIYGEVAGYGSTADAFRLTDTHDEGRGAIACIREALADAGVDARGRRLHQRPRHQHLGQRLGRDPGDQAGLRRRGLQGAGLQHQEHDGPPDRRGRLRRGDRLPPGDPRRRDARRRSTSTTPTPTATSTTSPTRPAGRRSTWRSRTASDSAARTSR